MSTAPRNKDRDRDRDRELSEILQEAQLLRAEVVQRALADAKKLGEPLWRLLLREGLLTDEQLFRVLKQYVRVPVLAEEHLENVVVPPELREALKPRLAQQLGVLPLERSTDGRRAALAMVDPTIDIAPLWPALSQLGVVEVRRFLLNLPTLRRGMQMFYGQQYESQSVDVDLDGPTPPPSRSAITQPTPRPAPEAPSVMVDPGLQAEIEQLSGSIPIPALSADDTGPITPSAGRPSMPGAPPATLPLGGPGGDPAVPSRSLGGGSAGQFDPSFVSGPNAAIPIEIDLPDLLAINSGENFTVPPPRELARRSLSASSSGTAIPALAPEGPRALQLPGRSGPVAAPASSAPASGAASSESARLAPRRSPTAPPLPPPSPAQSAANAPSTESARTTAPLPRRSPTIPPLPLNQSMPSAGSVPPLRPGLVAQPGPAPATPSARRTTLPPILERPVAAPLQPSAQSPLQELTAADMVLDDDRGGLRLNRRALRVPAASSEPAPAVAQDGLQDALIATCEALVGTVESQLRTSWPTTLARLCQGVGDQLGFAPRAVRELMLVARLRGVVRAELLARGPLPPPRPTLLGYPTSSPLLGAARELQKVLVDFMRLPQDEDEPLGMRIIATAAQALEQYDKGLRDEQLVAKLREQFGDTDVVFQVNKALALNPPPPDAAPPEPPPTTAIVPAAASAAPAPETPAAPTPPTPRPARALALWPLPPQMPMVAWTTLRVAELSDEGLLPYQPEEA